MISMSDTENKIKRILITSDRSLETTYRNNNFVGYLSSLPLGPIPRQAYNWFFPMPKVSSGNSKNSLEKPHLSIRTIQGILLNHFNSTLSENKNKIEIKIVHLSILDQEIKNGDLVLISSMDPLGIGPATSSWRFLKLGTPYHVYYFWDLLKKLNQLKRTRNFKILAGGAGMWQINDQEFCEKNGIDYLFIGEAEKDLPDFIEQILKDNNTPWTMQGTNAEEKDILPLIGPTNLYMTEVTRGCGRMCAFCAPTRSGKMRNVPKEVIFQTAENFVSQGAKVFNIQSEDTLRYGSANFEVDKDALLDLYNGIFDRGIKRIYMTHATLANIASAPDTVLKLSRILQEHGHKYYGFQPGIETGSDRIMRKSMAGKFLPMKDHSWSEIILEAFKVCDEARWIPTASLVLGFPDEGEDDLKETEILVRKLIDKDYTFLFAPLIFVPVPETPLGREHRPTFQKLNKHQLKVFKMMWKFNLRKIMGVWNVYNVENYEFSHWKSKFLNTTGSLLSKFF